MKEKFLTYIIDEDENITKYKYKKQSEDDIALYYQIYEHIMDAMGKETKKYLKSSDFYTFLKKIIIDNDLDDSIKITIEKFLDYIKKENHKSGKYDMFLTLVD